MNMVVVEITFDGIHSKSCGDDFYLKLPIEKVHQKMKERADSMPCQDVCVYCVSCIRFILLTHADNDHAGNAARLKNLTGAQIGILKNEAPVLAGEKKHRYGPGQEICSKISLI